MRYPHVAARIFNTPLLIHPDKLDAIVAGLGGRLLGDGQDLGDLARRALQSGHAVRQEDPAPYDAAQRPADLFTSRRGAWQHNADGTAYVVHEDIAIVSAQGVLAHRTRMQADSSMILGYQSIVRDLTAAVEDPDIRAVMLLEDTPGGESSGAFEAADTIHELAQRKPIHSMIDTLAASAGYLLAGATTERIIAPTGYAGSIGVVMRHVDVSRAMANEGIGVTHIYAGDHKVDGHSFAPLPEPVRAAFQAEIDDLYRLFVETVSRHTGLSEETVRGTQARMYRAGDAVKVGLANRVATSDQLLSELLARRPAAVSLGQPARIHASQQEHTMTTDTQKPAGATDQPAKLYTQAEFDQAVTAAREEGATSARAEAANAEAERVDGILAYADENQRSVAVAHTCIRQGLNVDQAKAVLDAAPASVALGQTLPSLATAGGHDLGPDGEQSSEMDAAAIAKGILSAFHGTRQ